MTIAQQLKNDGRQEGRQEKKLEIAKNLLAAEQPRSFVEKMTGLDVRQLDAIQS